MIQIYMNYIMKGDKNMKVKFFAAIMAMSICFVACGPLQEVGQDEVYTDLVCIPAAKMDELLIEKTGYSLQEMRDAGNDLQTGWNVNPAWKTAAIIQSYIDVRLRWTGIPGDLSAMSLPMGIKRINVCIPCL